MHHTCEMKINHLLLALLGLCVIPASADVTTYQGSSRWNTTFFRPQKTTAVGNTSYVTFYLVESFDGTIASQVKIDAWSARNPETGRLERLYYVDRDFGIEFGYFGRWGTDVGGGMQFDGVEAIAPFRGTYSSGALNSFTLYPVSDYYSSSNGLDVTQISGAARLNRSFSGPVSLNTALNAVVDYLESRGYAEAL
jgi:hypothetical protein